MATKSKGGNKKKAKKPKKKTRIERQNEGLQVQASAPKPAKGR